MRGARRTLALRVRRDGPRGRARRAIDNKCHNTYSLVVGLKEELKQNRPWRSLEEEASLNIGRTSAVLEHALAQALKPYDVTPTQYNVLRILRGAEPDGLCRNAVGERLIRRVPDVTRLLDRMEELGLVARVRGEDDRRFVTTHLAPRGRALVDDLDAQICRIHREQLGHLTETQLRQLIDLLTAVRAEEG
jgi:DNA-binding MarR family transcriptional regulator